MAHVTIKFKLTAGYKNDPTAVKMLGFSTDFAENQLERVSIYVFMNLEPSLNL